MNIENEVFKRRKLDKSRLIPYGFVEDNDNYKYNKTFLNGNFKAEITIDNEEQINGKIYDLETGDEYTNFRIENANGAFSNLIRDEYIKILKDIAEKCFTENLFIYNQANRLADAIKNKYCILPEFLWDKFPNFGVFRNSKSNKWFGIIMNLDKSKIINEKTGEIEILNVKLDGEVSQYLKQEGIYPAYHLSKKSWVTIILDDTLPDNDILNLIDKSYKTSDKNEEWIVPANPKYYDIDDEFNESNIILWKQSNNIKIGNIVYIYIASPVSAIQYKCQVLEVNIPYKYKDKNLSMDKVMKIKLLKKYDKIPIDIKLLNEYGVKNIRGPRNMPDTLKNKIEELYNK